MHVEKKYALVTGGATGIGAGIVKKLSLEGYNVIACYNRSKKEAEEIMSNFELVEIENVDVTSEESVRELSRRLSTKGCSIHCIINNAGGNISFKSTEDYSSSDWDSTFSLNCKSVFLMSKYLIPMISDGGSIVNISSISGKSGGAPGGMAYAASKAAVDCMTKSLAKELAIRDINVNAVSPGIVYTYQHQNFSSREYYDSLIEKVPLGRDGTVEDVANLVHYLVSESGSYITGQIIGVNGGMMMV